MVKGLRLTGLFRLVDDLFQFQGNVIWNLKLSFLDTMVSALHYLQLILYVPSDFELITALALAAKQNVTNTYNSLLYFSSEKVAKTAPLSLMFQRRSKIFSKSNRSLF